MLGAMQDFPLLVTNLIDHAEREHGPREIVTHWSDGELSRSNWATVALEARKFAQMLERLGMKRGDRVATIAMNHAHHISSWYGTAGMGGILHTINPRLHADQLVYVLNHAGDRLLFVDAMFLPLVEAIRDRLETVEQVILFDNAKPGGELKTYRELIDAEDGDYAWVSADERDPVGLCYTSGTTGNPKGVLYEHRSNVLHAMTALQPAVMDLSSRSVMLPIVPMFHANAWGIPFAAAAVGAKMVCSCSNDGGVLWKLFREEKVTFSAGVPTVWLAMFADMDANGGDYGALERVVIGGSAAPRAMIERLKKAGITVAHAWGMTETSPIGTTGARPHNWAELDFDAQVDIITKQGRPPFGVELRVVDEDGQELPRDGESSGRLHVRGPWVLRRYFRAEEDTVDADGWFDTGDVSVLYPDGTMQITDRAKDVIKSGGEWISSIELENEALGCDGVAEAAAVGVHHPKWDERPLLLIVRKPGSGIGPEDILDHLQGRVAKWWLPDEIKFVEELPHTATGKILKRAIRDEYADYKLETIDE